MDREFMRRYYDKVYDDPVGEAVGTDPAYEKLHTELLETGKALLQLSGDSTSELWDLHEQYVMLLHQMDQIAWREIYLMGAADRERMLR